MTKFKVRPAATPFLAACLSVLFTTLTAATVFSQKQPKVSKEKREDLALLQSIAADSLDSSIDELRNVEAVPTRIDLAEGIVRLLRARMPARCRQLLDSLFDSVSQLRKSNDGKKPLYPTERPDVLIRRVIKIAATLDPKLAQQYAEKYAADKEPSAGGGASSNDARAASELYLRLATDLVEQNPALAVSIAEKGIADTLVPGAVIFLETLRKKDVETADRFFLSALEGVARRRGQNVNELFLLYSYVFSPSLAPVVVRDGLSVVTEVANYRRMIQSRPVDPNLARQYLQAASGIMLDPARYQAGVGQLPAGAAGDLYFIRIIEPQIAAYLPGMGDAAAAQRSLVSNFLDQERRTSLQKTTDRWNASLGGGRQNPAAGESTLEAELQEAEEVKDSEERDQKFYTIAAHAVTKGSYDAALDVVGRLSSKYADRGRQFIMFSIAEREIKDNHLERAEQWAMRDDDLPRRAYILNLIADSAATGGKNVPRAVEVLAGVEAIASKLDAGQEKIATLVGAAGVYSRFDEARASELLRQAISVADKVEKFAGDARLSRVIEIGGFGFVYYLYDDKLTLQELLGRLGRKSFVSTMTDVQSLKSRVPRIRATIDLCAAILSPGTNSKT